MPFLSNAYSSPYRKDRTNHGGGILKLKFTPCSKARPWDILRWIHPDRSQGKIWIISDWSFFFYSPTTSNSQFFNSLNINIEKASEYSKNLILVGDLNEDLLNPNFHNLKDLIIINSMTNVITETTRQQAILDPVIIPEDLPFLDSGTIEVPNNISDYKATYIKLPFQCDTEGAYNRLIWLYRKANFFFAKTKNIKLWLELFKGRNSWRGLH